MSFFKNEDSDGENKTCLYAFNPMGFVLWAWHSSWVFQACLKTVCDPLLWIASRWTWLPVQWVRVVLQYICFPFQHVCEAWSSIFSPLLLLFILCNENCLSDSRGRKPTVLESQIHSILAYVHSNQSLRDGGRLKKCRRAALSEPFCSQIRIRKPWFLTRRLVYCALKPPSP